ncbi:MAG: tetratricopeptide repeat protein [Desulfobacteraceae bacterium]|jgi:cytochrome c-type biogenesis protein CcmH/NrfG|nr:tetratricopeptide repeat protein [Desulfobacteraceae bacterium]
MIKNNRIRSILILLATAIILAGCSDKDEKMAYYDKAKNCYNNNEFLCAKIALEKAVEIDPEFAGAYANLGEVYLKLGKVSESLNAYIKAAELAPDQPEVQIKLATLYMLNRKTVRAKKILEKILDNNPDNMTANYLLAEFFEMEKDFDRSAQLFKTIINKDHSQIRAYLSLAALLIKKGRYDEAEISLKSAQTNIPSSLHTIIAIFDL